MSNTLKARFSAGLLICITLISCGQQHEEVSLPEFELKAGSPREIAFTDKGDAFWVTRTGGYHHSPWHGLTAAKRAYFEDLFIEANGDLLPREKALVTVSPAALVREYPKLGIRETWTLLDTSRSLLLVLEAEKAMDWGVQPAILGGNKAEDFDITAEGQVLKVHLKSVEDLPASYPYLTIWFSHDMVWEPAVPPEHSLFTAYLTPHARYSTSHRLAILVRLSREDLDLQVSPGWMAAQRSNRSKRLNERLARTTVTSNLAELDQAITWAHASLDALIMNQMGRGIYAGLPWFDDYWGRDLFISFPGAILVAGDWRTAREILRDFATYQDRDPESRTFGRIPNRAQPGDIIYNTTDGTPWFVRSVWDYLRYSGDQEFLSEIWPAVRLATEGALQNWIDEDGLLRHDDADTWMDAKGGQGPWSPRGDRAIDIQFLWRDQLNVTRLMAEVQGDAEMAAQCIAATQKLNVALEGFFFPGTEILVDHLNADGSQDLQQRPNALLIPPVLGPTANFGTFAALAPELVTAEGVLSLAQDDPNFHPYHQMPGRYVKDAAYHNGIIWNWNAGPVMTHAIAFRQYEMARLLFHDLTHELLERGAVGTLAEVKDAWPRSKGEPVNLSGTFSQAWSLAEYLRVFYQDILGFRPDLTRPEHPRVSLKPRLFEAMQDIRFNGLIGEDTWQVRYLNDPDFFAVDIERESRDAITLEISLDNGTEIKQLQFTWSGDRLRIRYERGMGQWTLPESLTDVHMSAVPAEPVLNSVPLAVVDMEIEVPALKGPEHRLLTTVEVQQKGGEVIRRVLDRPGDDRGSNGRFTYPTNPQFQDGIADIQTLEVFEGADFYRFVLGFRNLVDPGWHPEFGYQLTYASMAIDLPDRRGNRNIGRNSRDSWQDGVRADYIIHVSGAIRVSDHKHRTLAEYLPATASDAIGDIATGKVTFSLPKDLIKADLRSSRLQVAVGLQDDHGGAGLGDFRDVKPQAGEWWGGGNTEGGSNVYDWLID